MMLESLIDDNVMATAINVLIKNCFITQITEQQFLFID